MVKIQKCKRFGVCNDCGIQQSGKTPIWEIKASVAEQGWNTIMLCPDCISALQKSLNAVIAMDSCDRNKES